MTAPLDLDLEVEAGDWQRDEIAAIEAAVIAALDGALSDGALWDENAVPTDGTEDEGDGASLLSVAPVIEIGVRLSDDASVRILNRDYREKDKPTNVLSFAALESAEDAEAFMMAPDMPLMLGDIVIARETCAREAIEQQKTLKNHLVHLAVHGTLHLVGYDHMVDDEAEEMEDLERQILAGLGIDDPYAPIEDEPN
ncbi:rRNA maturation RNase YbeY [Thalassospira sp. HF15]|uniref:rRNA maturation RNase YbeY n=1 Tax=Thalassospira sp. HF15 TaxID=2722755 RepID=UPI00142FCE24|nr:rRNA maturation RNase YbeY [Thalassospira sp. HF15]NIY74984.1 rRNA maturation RNase YbeY [Thalassospira sp. HF15]